MTNQALQEPTLQEVSPSAVGQILRTARLERGITIEQIAKTLCINKRQLSHLENDAEHLVCDVYTLGFVKLYAQYLEYFIRNVEFGNK